MGGTLQEELALAGDLHCWQRRQRQWDEGTKLFPRRGESLILPCDTAIHDEEPLIRAFLIKGKRLFLKEGKSHLYPLRESKIARSPPL
jgi:hypothetical protein